MAFVHSSVNKTSQSYLSNEQRYNYTTPKSFLEFIRLYQSLLYRNSKDLKSKMERLENGLLKLDSTSAQASTLLLTHPQGSCPYWGEWGRKEGEEGRWERSQSVRENIDGSQGFLRKQPQSEDQVPPAEAQPSALGLDGWVLTGMLDSSLTPALSLFLLSISHFPSSSLSSPTHFPSALVHSLSLSYPQVSIL